MIFWLTLAILVTAIVLAFVLDRPILTPIPKSVLGFVRAAKRGPWLLTLWRVFLLIVLLSVAGILVAQGGVLAGFVAAVILSILFSSAVKSVVNDLWDANFVRVDP